MPKMRTKVKLLSWVNNSPSDRAERREEIIKAYEATIASAFQSFSLESSLVSKKEPVPPPPLEPVGLLALDEDLELKLNEFFAEVESRGGFIISVNKAPYTGGQQRMYHVGLGVQKPAYLAKNCFIVLYKEPC